MAAIDAADRPVHPDDARIAGCQHVVFHAPGRDGADARAATSIHPGWLDRSPCGTGTSARLAQLHARGELAVGEAFVNESVIGTRFTGRVAEETTVGGRPAIVPEITGRAWITGHGAVPARRRGPVPGRLRPVTDVVVVGAGIVGAAVARELAVRGVRGHAARPRRGVERDDRARRGQRALLRQGRGAGARPRARRARALRRARGAARRRGADPPQGRADRAPGGRRPGPASPRGSRGVGDRRARGCSTPPRCARCEPELTGDAARRELLPGRPAVRSARDRAGARRARPPRPGPTVRDGLRGRRRRRPRGARPACARGRRAGRRRTPSCSPRAPWSRGARRRAPGLALPLEPRKGQLVRLAAPGAGPASATRSSTAPTCARSRSAGSRARGHAPSSRRRGRATCSSARRASGAASTRPSTPP